MKSSSYPCIGTIIGLACATVLCGRIQAADSSQTIRIATYNVSLYGKQAGQVRERLSDGDDRRAKDIATVIQLVRPDVLLLNEIDHDADGATVKLFVQKFLGVAQHGNDPIDYPYVYSVPSNTGVDSGMDLNNNNRVGEPPDCWGFGVYPGQYSMAILSRFPIQLDQLRSYQKFLWKDLPDNSRPIDPETNTSYFNEATWSKLRLV